MGFYIKYTLEDLQIELGVSKCPLLYDYKIWGDLATNTWIKALWESIQKYILNQDSSFLMFMNYVFSNASRAKQRQERYVIVTTEQGPHYCDTIGR